MRKDLANQERAASATARRSSVIATSFNKSSFRAIEPCWKWQYHCWIHAWLVTIRWRLSGSAKNKLVASALARRSHLGEVRTSLKMQVRESVSVRVAAILIALLILAVRRSGCASGCAKNGGDGTLQNTD
jgi:hypothetical protein